MNNKDLDHEILKLIEGKPEISERDIASTLSVPEELVKIRIANLKDTRQKILIMGDGESISNIKATLEAENYNIVRISGSFSALEAVKTEKPDLILLDTGLADLEGFKICKQLRASPRYWWIPVMMLSERKEVKNRVEAFESGADDYVTTPFNPLELRARVGMILKRTQV
ncbi:MAG: response regulator [Methanosarcina sp.]|jgi:two-component system alkaline phosphatase synthesis response regulator PhoP|nr:response regulator [Methanosarcina sp.]MDD4523366.1 response regulator [Methanosarcina sp.]HHV23470.1 response regulator [Methanosarcina sp.]